MEKQLVITQVDISDLRRILREAVEEEVVGLRQEVEALREELRLSRHVITHKEATFYFDGDVKPATIIEYINFRGLPAYKNGRKWFIYLGDLLDWQIGLIGFAEKQEEPCVVAPRHEREPLPSDILNPRHALEWRAADRQLRQIALF